MMAPDKPVPLREALRDAFVEYANGMGRIAAAGEYISQSLADETLAAMNRVTALIEQVPADIETHDAE